MKEKSAYFYLIPEGVSRDAYAHNALSIAEGLKELGWKIYANLNYWKPTEVSDFLFHYDSLVRPSDCRVIFLTYDWMHFINVIPYELKENNDSVRVYLEDAGWLDTPGLSPEFKYFDFVLKSHFNWRCNYPSNYRPWAFGLTNRILRETRESMPFSDRRNSMLVNFGATHTSRHQLREAFEREVYPKLGKNIVLDRATNSRSQPPLEEYHRWMWQQTAWRHYPDYYAKLRESRYCSCIGGQLIPGYPGDPSLLAGGGRRKKLETLFYRIAAGLAGKTPRWNQWESWRWWESLSAGCVSLMLDFEKYGAQLPVQPVNWEHYVGIDLDNVDQGIERFLSAHDSLEQIAVKGRDWAIENYSPRATASRFLKLIGEL
jgi:hypothetical protein